MKHLYFLWLIFLPLLVACNSKPDTSDTPATPDTPVAVNEARKNLGDSSCYTSTSPKDTVLLHMRRQGNNVTGSLIYSIFEKDRNTGTITGKFRGDTLFATYTFMSEGTESVRDLTFMKKGDELVEGYGTGDKQNGKSASGTRSRVRYGGGIILTKTDCP
ncbi:hypothetical protein [Pontibacter ruber]|uniref:Lipoprotein n=1 Tax=Pontibacter ruber TaxID=1343895 RepID=A0ABW5CXV5_9BACT|nr:hypothetical protein [Pontibacter ruber]